MLSHVGAITFSCGMPHPTPPRIILTEILLGPFLRVEVQLSEGALQQNILHLAAGIDIRVLFSAVLAREHAVEYDPLSQEGL